MKKMIECQATVLPDGHLALPDEVTKEISLEQQVKVQITFEVRAPVEDLGDGWEILRNMARTAGEGRLPDVAEHHDRYLYGR